MFRDGFIVRGIGASILWGSNAIPAARITKWSVTRAPDPGGGFCFLLAAALAPGGLDAFKLRQSPLYFTAARIKGFWMFRIRDVQVGTHEIRARLAPPEQ